jgi:outer membrane protein OmpA-like peptidoglycan-associated protein
MSGNLILAALLLILPADASAQSILKRVKRSAENAVASSAERATTNAVNCALGDNACQTKAKAEGKKVVIDSTTATPPAGADTTTRTEKTEKSEKTEKAEPLVPGKGAWANYDFVPGDRVLFADDFSKDNVGDFPRRLEFIGGNMEIVEWNAARWVSAGSRGDFLVPLPEVLPEKFTLEFALTGWGNGMEIHFVDPATNPGQNVNFSVKAGGIQRNGVTALGESRHDTSKEVVTGRVMADGRYVKVFVDEVRVANVPTANLGRSNRIWFRLNGWDATHPRMVGNIRVTAGGKTMYDAIESAGRVATQGIYFDTGSDRIRPESSGTLKQIATMLNEHAELKLTIEGHTDNVGNAASNQSLSENRARAVKDALVSLYGVAAERLESVGFGDTKPAGANATPEGRQNNRRVELVKR